MIEKCDYFARYAMRSNEEFYCTYALRKDVGRAGGPMDFARRFAAREALYCVYVSQ